LQNNLCSLGHFYLENRFYTWFILFTLHRYAVKQTSYVLSSGENPLYDAAVDDQLELQAAHNVTYVTVQKKNIGDDSKAHSFKNESFDFGD